MHRNSRHICTKCFMLKCIGSPPFSPNIFIKGNNLCEFLFASLDNVAFPKWGPFIKERISSLGSKFCVGVIRIEKGSKNENAIVASP